MAGTPLMSLIALLAVAATGTTTVLVARQLSAPTAKPLVGVCLFLFATALSQFVGLVSPSLWAATTGTAGAQLSAESLVALALALTLPAAGLWLLFALVHTGRGSQFRRQVTVLVLGLLGIFYSTSAYLWFQNGFAFSTETLLPPLATGLFLFAGLAALATMLIVEAALRRNAVPLGEAVTLALGASLFVYGPMVAFQLGRPILVVVPLILSSSLLALAVHRYPVFETLPVARIAARDRLVEEIDDAVLLVDEQGRVVDSNPAARALFAVAPETDGDTRLSTLASDVPPPEELVANTGPVRLQTGGQTLAVTGDRVTDERDRAVGYLVLCRDVSDRTRRERRLRVLTRFLAQTLDEPMAAVAARAEQITAASRSADTGGGGPAESDDQPPSALAREIRQTSGSLKRLVTATRRVERALSEQRTASCNVGAAVREIATELEGELRVDYQSESEISAPVDPSLLRAVVRLLLEDWLERYPAAIGLTVGATGQGAALIELSPVSPVAAGESGSNGEDSGGLSNAQGEPTATAADGGAAVALSRLALEHAGGVVERPAADRSTVRIRFGTASQFADADRRPDTGERA